MPKEIQRGKRVLPCVLAALMLAGAHTQGATFLQEGVAFLEKHCTSCHGKEKQKAGLALHDARDEAAVLRTRKQWRDVLRMVETGEMPPEEKPRPSAEERRLFAESVRAVFAKADAAPPDPGRLTLRRLNRAEYNNTIRDLLKIDFRPADDFPSDDVGHGFDNIADVLTLSPVLMERYLEAAEQIAAQAIPLSAAAPPKRTMSAKFCEPASPRTPQDRFRPVVATEQDPVFSGPLNTPARVTPDGDYIMRARLFAKSPDGRPVRVALMVAGPMLAQPSPAAELSKIDGTGMRNHSRVAIVRVVEVTARSEKDAQVVEARLPRMQGIERIVFGTFRPGPGQAAPTLFVEYLEYEGPLDTRSPETKTLLVSTPGKPQAEQTREILSRFATRAWRRPVTTDELDRLVKLVAYGMGHNDSWEEAMRRAVSAVLSSPKFLFRLEPDDQPANPQPHPVNEFQLATRLSYFLWSSCPDDRLLALAEAGRLTASLDEEIERMLQDSKAGALVDNFGLQWLQLGRLAAHSADPNTFPTWRPELRAAMLEETRRFLSEVIRTDRSVLDLLDGAFTWVNRPLAEFYGLKSGPTKADEWKRVSLEGTSRGGLLTQASILTVTSNPTRTSPVKRGKWILEQILGTPPPPPPPDTPSLDDSRRKELTGTFRQKLEQHRADPKCANCHSKMDAFGFALENFDGVGRWRDRDETGAPIDTGGTLSGRKVAGLDDIRALLRSRRNEFARCVAEKMYIYALGRGTDWYDEPALARIVFMMEKNDYRFGALISAIVKSQAFLMRRGSGGRQ